MDIKFDEFRDDACKYSRPGIDTRLVCTMDPDGLEFLCTGVNCPFMKKSNRRHQQEHKGTKEEYLTQYECFNCGTKFTKFVPMGKTAEGEGGNCPYCGVPDELSNRSWAHKVLGYYIPEHHAPQ